MNIAANTNPRLLAIRSRLREIDGLQDHHMGAWLDDEGDHHMDALASLRDEVQALGHEAFQLDFSSAEDLLVQDEVMNLSKALG